MMPIREDCLENTQIKVSIIMPVFNGIRTIEKAIISVLKQTYKNFEYIILDGGSSDGSIAIIKKFEKKIDHWVSEPDNGIYDAMNKGITLAKGEWLFFIGSDDQLYNENILETIFKESHEDFYILYGNILYKNFTSGSEKLFISKYNHMLFLKNSLHHQATFYHRSLFNNFRYNNTLKISSDYELNLKSFIEKIPAKNINQIVSICGSSGISTAGFFQGYREQISIRSDYINPILKLPLNIQTILRFIIKSQFIH
jgi:putative colanic acid biosynthesis glycosyltransferase